jgi:hypothetical protein
VKVIKVKVHNTIPPIQSDVTKPNQEGKSVQLLTVLEYTGVESRLYTALDPI